MLQGDSYRLGFRIKRNGIPVKESDVFDVEICIGSLIKTYSKDELAYADEKWYFPFEQEETFAMTPKKQPVQVRVYYKSGDVKGSKLNPINIEESLSKTVL